MIIPLAQVLLAFILALLFVRVVASTALLVLRSHELRLASGPLAGSAAFVGVLDVLLDLVAELGVGVFVFGWHLENGRAGNETVGGLMKETMGVFTVLN